MIRLEIPGRDQIELTNAVFDVNGTLAVDGTLVEGIQKKFRKVQETLNIYLLTADTHGAQQAINDVLDMEATIIEPGNEAEQKAAFVEDLGASQTIAFGQGANDAKMMSAAVIGICLLSEEGTALQTLLNADLIVPDIHSALTLLENPIRLVASLRD